MSVYRVKEGQTVLWPGGAVRAESGELFEGFEDAGRPAGRDYASALLWDARGQIEPVLEECDGDIRCDMPKDVQQALTFFNGVAPQAPKPKAKKKARAKKAKAADEPTAD